jgi:carboxypeptidase PM20D1
MVEYFRQQGIAPALVLDEGGAVIDNAPLGVKGLFAAIGVSEKGIANFRVTTNAKGGHASTPAPSDATAKLVSGLESLQRHPAPARLHAATKAMLRELAARGGLGLKLVFANLWLFGPLVLRIMKNNSETAAMVRTTYALTELAGSKAANVIPKQAHATINARIDSSESIAEAFARLQKHFDDQTEFTIADANEPSPISPFDASGTATSAWGSQANSPAGTAAPAAKPELGDKPQLGDKPEPGDKPHRQVDNPIDNPAGTDPGFEYLRRVTHSVYPEAGCAPYLMSAATDARHFTAICPRVYRFAGILFKGDQRNTVHGQNENIDILSFQRGVGFYRQFLQYLDQLRL